MWAVLRFGFKSPDRYIMGSEEKTGHVSQWWAHYFHNQNCEEDSFNIMANLWHSWFTRIGFAALHFDQNLGLWRHLWLLSSLAPMTTYLFVFFHRSPPLYTWSQDFFGINLQSYIWCLCKFVLLSYKQSFLWHIRIITEHTYWKRTSCSPLLPSWANERLCALGAGAQLFKLSNPVDRQTREKGPNCDSSPPLH